MSRAWILAVAISFALLPLEVSAGEKIKEPATGVEFDATLDGGYELLGVGVRKKLAFKIYATALYVKVPDAIEPLRSASDPFEPIVNGTFPRKMVMHFNLPVPGNKARSTFRKNFDRVLTAEEQTRCVEDRKRYLEAMGGNIKKGERYIMDYAQGRIRVFLSGNLVYETSNRTMIQGIFRIWYGPEPLSEKLKQDLLSRLKTVIN